MTQRDEHRSLYLSYLEYCNEHDVDRMASFYTSTIRVNDVPMDPAAGVAQFAPLFSAHFLTGIGRYGTSSSTATISRCTSRSPVPTGRRSEELRRLIVG